MKKYILIPLLGIITFTSCNQKEQKPTPKPETPFLWEAANLYFLLTDRFNNGDTTNDVNFN